MNKNWIIISGNAVTSFGNSMYVVSLFIFAAEVYPDPLSIGLIQTAFYLPIVLFSLSGGRIADRRNRPHIIAGTDFSRSLFLVSGAALILMFSKIHPFYIIIPMIFMNSVMHAFFSPAIVSLVLDQKRGKRDLLSLRTGSGHLASLAGQTTGALLYPVSGLIPLLAVNSLCFFLSGISELFLKEPRKLSKLQKSDALNKNFSLKYAVIEFINLEKNGVPVFMYFGMQAVNSLIVLNLPFFITRRLGFESRYIGFALAGLLGGSILAGFILGFTGLALKIKSSSSYAAVFTASAVYYSASLISLKADEGLSFLFPLALLITAGGCLGWIHLATVHQVFRKGPGESAGSRQGFLEASTAAVLPLTYLTSSFLASKLPLDTPWILRSAAFTAFLLALCSFFLKVRRK